MFFNSAKNIDIKNFFFFSNQRKQYQGSCLFVWAADKGTYTIVQTEDLIEVKNTQEASMEDCLWNPAQNLARQLKPSWPSFPLVQSVISLTNQPELNGKFFIFFLI